MTEVVKNFIETNYQLLDSNPVEFFHSAYNSLSEYNQKLLIDVLQTANIDIEKARESVIHFIITMQIEFIERPVSLSTFIDRYLYGILGYNGAWLKDYIINNQSEWNDSVHIEKDNNGVWMIYPVV